MEFWELFDYLCAQKGVSKRKACEEMGFSPSLAAKAKNAGTKPRVEFVSACANYFNVGVDYLLGKSDGPKTEDPRQLVFENYGQRVLFDTSKGVPSSKLLEVAALIEQWKEQNDIVD